MDSIAFCACGKDDIGGRASFGFPSARNLEAKDTVLYEKCESVWFN